MTTLAELQQQWEDAWPEAIAVWSRFTKLQLPRWCHDKRQRQAEGLTGSFAMIRLNDHAVVIGLDLAYQQGVHGFPLQILAHEIGHHVYAPGDLTDNARMLARIRYGLPSRESYAPMVANLYTDLLINDRLQRSAGLDMAAVYEVLREEKVTEMWALYMRIYEVLWSLPFGTLVPEDAVTPRIATDATLGARLIRVYAKRWLDGSGRFAALVLDYLLKEKEQGHGGIAPWMDALSAGKGGEMPEGLAEMEADEIDGAIHPADDPEISGLDATFSDAVDPNYGSAGVEQVGGQKNRYRSPTEYIELMKSVGVEVDEKDLVIRYYRERAVRNLVPFPMQESVEASDPLPEGLEVWDVGAPVQKIDWVQSVIRSPVVIPGLTTMERVYGTTQGTEPERTPVDLYLGVDCSGSMTNPAARTSFPVIAGTIIILSALRSGSRAMVCLSGEPGQFSETDGFTRNERDNLGVLTGYLGTGYSYGIERLRDTFVNQPDNHRRPIHLLIVTDSDIFRMIEDTVDGWEVFARALEIAGGGGTLVLDRSDFDHYRDTLDRIAGIGWDIHHVVDQASLVDFARAFARRHYGND